MSLRERQELHRAVLLYLAWCFKRETRPQVAELAEIVGMTPSAFSRRFKRVCGENPSVILKRAQLERAMRGIARGKSVNRAGYGAGFGTRTSIYRAFQRAFGETPSSASRR